MPQAPQIQPPPKRIWSSSTELQLSPQGQRQPQPSVWPQKSSCLTQIPETPGPSLLDMSPSSEWQERTLGSSLRQAIDMPEQTPTLPFHLTPQQFSARTSQHITGHHSGTTLQSPDQAVESLWHHDSSTPRLQTKRLPSNDPFQRSLLHDILTKLEIVMEQQRNIVRMVQDLKENNVREITEANDLTTKCFPIEDLRSLTSLESDLQSKTI
ncbi:uncharacterized protein LOC117596562 [Pangasianodon hypophthalmus]|uniref:uncharacterized protein LOC117596562 n=1 Tax=Pangasianodon hypophthalmus TaxID=310915 RepID=UPI00147A46D1|nr:uncharacterized protein LOC117596562 [Pangasianodon hypophthalmus]